MFSMKKFFAGAVFAILALVALFSAVTASGRKVITISNQGVKTDETDGEVPEEKTVEG